MRSRLSQPKRHRRGELLSEHREPSITIGAVVRELVKQQRHVTGSVWYPMVSLQRDQPFTRPGMIVQPDDAQPTHLMCPTSMWRTLQRLSPSWRV
jgi:hypothetical protein